MNILVFGASGATGHELVRQALAQGHIVTAFVRNPEKLALSHNNLKLVKGDINDPAAVEAAVNGQHAVLSALGASSSFRFDQQVVDGVRTIVKAMQQSGIMR